MGKKITGDNTLGFVTILEDSIEQERILRISNTLNKPEKIEHRFNVERREAEERREMIRFNAQMRRLAERRTGTANWDTL